MKSTSFNIFYIYIYIENVRCFFSVFLIFFVMCILKSSLNLKLSLLTFNLLMILKIKLREQKKNTKKNN
jgi:hypothetical protein